MLGRLGTESRGHCSRWHLKRPSQLWWILHLMWPGNVLKDRTDQSCNSLHNCLTCYVFRHGQGMARVPRDESDLWIYKWLSKIRIWRKLGKLLAKCLKLGILATNDARDLKERWHPKPLVHGPFLPWFLWSKVFMHHRWCMNSAIQKHQFTLFSFPFFWQVASSLECA